MTVSLASIVAESAQRYPEKTAIQGSAPACLERAMSIGR